MKLALAMIVKGADAEAEALGTCLGMVCNFVDDIFITITHRSGEGRNEKVDEVCKIFNTKVSDFEWCNDFAAARNFNFSHVPKEFDYILWLDADDGIRGIEKLRATMEAHPADVYSFYYLYAFDADKNPIIVHHKTRVIKNDGCVSWAGRLHEDFKENRTLTRFHINGIEVLHLSTEERFEAAKERNYEVAAAQMQNEPNDPRSYWNLGNSAFAVGKIDEAISLFDKFLNISLSDDEKYIVRLRRAEAYLTKGNVSAALDETRYAIGTKPNYPDAYHLAGKILMDMRDWWKAREMLEMGLVRKPPYYSIIVFNPRDYDYHPLLSLAKCYYELSLPQLSQPLLKAALKICPSNKSLRKTLRTIEKEAEQGEKILKLVSKMRKMDKAELGEALAKIPKDFRYHPEICRLRNVNFPKTESSGKDLVIMCGHTAEEWTAESIKKKGSGGSEEAAVNLSEGLAELGWNVTIYNNCGTEAKQVGKVLYKPYMGWNYRDKQDVVILWRQTKALDWEINAPKIYVDMHDVMPPGEFTEERVRRLTKVFFKSHWHRNLFPAIPEEKTMVIPNGIDLKQFSEAEERDPNLIINTASPVRCLTALCDIMKEVKKAVPEVKCQWAYGWTVTDTGMEADPRYLPWKKKLLANMSEAGIESLGRLTHQEIAKLYLKANIYVYPTGFPEIDCMSITKSLAAGTFPITTDFGAIAEKAGNGGEFINYEESYQKPGQMDFSVISEEVKKEFVSKLIHYLQNPPTEQDRERMRQAAKKYEWKNIINQWQACLSK